MNTILSVGTWIEHSWAKLVIGKNLFIIYAVVKDVVSMDAR